MTPKVKLRTYLLVTAMLFLWMGVGFLLLQSTEAITPIPWALAAFSSAILLCIFTFRYNNHVLYAITGTVGTVAICARIVAVGSNLLHGGIYASPWIGLVALPIYIIAGLGYNFFWKFGIGTLVHEQQDLDLERK